VLARSAALMPDHWVTSLKLGQALNRVARYEEAIRALSQAAQRNPRGLSPFVERAAAYAALGNLDGAMADLETALKLDPNAKRLRARLAAFQAERDALQSRA
jgi:Flp pilus assembly protein TadD